MKQDLEQLILHIEQFVKKHKNNDSNDGVVDFIKDVGVKLYFVKKRYM